MIDINTIEQEIMNLEKKDTSYAVIERLSWLYIVRDHMQTYEADEKTGRIIGSEFAEVCSNVPIDSLISILSEHFEGIKALYPKEYDLIIERIRAIK